MYKIEINANTLAELAGKVLALAAQLNETASEAPRYVGPLTGEAEPEVAEAAPADPTPETQTGGAVPPVEPAPEPEASEPTPSAPSAEASASDELDFDTDVAPYVLQVVKEKGKPVAQEILSQFGVDRASLLEPHLWPELVEQLKDAL